MKYGNAETKALIATSKITMMLKILARLVSYLITPTSMP